MILAVIKQLGAKAFTPHILKRLGDLHAQGRWPEAPWQGAVQAPYAVGLSQNLTAMASTYRNAKPWLVRIDKQGHYTRWELTKDAPKGVIPPKPKPLTPEERQAKADALLPAREAVEDLMNAFQRRTGQAVVIGVRHADLIRVIRVETARGPCEFTLEEGEEWRPALERLLW